MQKQSSKKERCLLTQRVFENARHIPEVKMMGITSWTTIAIIILAVLIVMAFLKKLIKAGIFIAILLLLGLLVLWHMWIGSPM